MKLLKIVAIVLLSHVILGANTYNKVLLTDPEALCLDGTKGAYYVHQGTQKTKFLLSFQGGGWCGSSKSLAETLDDCYSRSNGALGSSSSYAPSFSSSNGIFGDGKQNYFKDWIKIFLKYCDGTGHQGYKKEPVSYKGKNLYFRGHSVAIGQFHSINDKYKISSVATQIVVTGQSAGGLATFLWANVIAQKAPKTAKVWAMPDSGIFLDQTNVVANQNNYRLLIQNFMKISNLQIDPPTKQCVAAHANQKWKCMFAQYNHQFITVPIFAIQSLYDSWSVPNILGLHCQNGSSFQSCNTTQMNFIEKYHAGTSAVLKQIGRNKKSGYWAPACSNHVYSSGGAYQNNAFKVPANSVNTLSHCVDEWITQKSVSYAHMDQGNWPVNKPCSGLPSHANLMME